MIADQKSLNAIAQTQANEVLKTEEFVVVQYKTDCLAEFAYYIESNGEAAFIDPMRDIKPYLDTVAERKSKTLFVFETHCHADFVSGHLDLANRTGSKIVFGPEAHVKFPFYGAKDNEDLQVGSVKIRVLHTPGHTPESSSFLLINSSNKNVAVFTGDTVFLGDVGRPDLAASENVTREDLANMLFESIKTKILNLEDDVILYPGHGAGSSCGKSIGKGNSCTVGRQKENNYALKPMAKEDFVKAVTADIPNAPQYFFYDAHKNREIIPPLDEVVAKNSKPLSIEEFKSHVKEGAFILDVRDYDSIVNESIPGSVGITLKGFFGTWVGSLIKPETPIVLVVKPGDEYEALMRLARIGYDNVKGYLNGGVTEWVISGNPVQKIPCISAAEFKNKLSENPFYVDVRKKNEVAEAVVEGAKWIELIRIEAERESIPKDRPVYFSCQTGARSTIAVTIMHKHGWDNVINVSGGFKALQEAGCPTKPYVHG